MPSIEFSSEAKELLVTEILRFTTDKLDADIGRFEAMDLFDFFSEKIGPYFYNKGLLDAQAVLSKRMDSVVEAIGELEKATELDR